MKVRSSWQQQSSPPGEKGREEESRRRRRRKTSPSSGRKSESEWRTKTTGGGADRALHFVRNTKRCVEKSHIDVVLLSLQRVILLLRLLQDAHALLPGAGSEEPLQGECQQQVVVVATGTLLIVHVDLFIRPETSSRWRTSSSSLTCRRCWRRYRRPSPR